jgi:hypothetical protein
VGGNAGGEKKLTWSERQALAKARDKEEEERSMAGTCVFPNPKVITQS